MKVIISSGENSTMKIQRQLLALLALAAAPTLAFAQPYASVQLGYANADFPLGAPYNGVVDDSAPMLGIEAGIAFGKWGAELGAPFAERNAGLDAEHRRAVIDHAVVRRAEREVGVRVAELHARIRLRKGERGCRGQS